MAHGPSSIPRTAVAAMVIVVALVVAACGDTPPPTSPGSPQPTGPSASASAPAVSTSPGQPTPAPTPVDASAAFVATITDPAFAASVAITGSATLGTIESASTGTLEIDGPDSHLALATKTGKTTSAIETLVVDGDGYAMTLPAGMWFAVTAPGVEGLAGSLAASDAGVTDLGVETKDGEELHHLVIEPPDTIWPVLGIDRATFTSVTTTMDAWVEEDGMPVVIEVGGAWTQAVDGKPVTATRQLALTFSDLPAGTTISAPETVWQWNTSARFHYRMAYPVGWTFKPGTAKYADAYYGFDNTAVYASRGRNRGLSLKQLSGSLSRYLPQITGIKAPKVISKTSARLGSLPARRIEYSYVSAKVRYWSIMYLAVKGRYYYTVEYETRHKTTAEDRAMAAQFASSFSAR